MANVVAKLEKKLKSEPHWVWYVGALGSIAAIIALAIAMHKNQATAGVAAAVSTPNPAPGSTGGTFGTAQPMAAPMVIPTSTNTVTDTTYAPISTVSTSTSSVDSHNFSQVFGNSGGVGGQSGGCDTCNAVGAAFTPLAAPGNTGPAPLTLEELQAKIRDLGSAYALDTANHNPTAAMAAHQQAAMLRDQGAMAGLGTLVQGPAGTGYDVLRTASGASV